MKNCMPSFSLFFCEVFFSLLRVGVSRRAYEVGEHRSVGVDPNERGAEEKRKEKFIFGVSSSF